MGFYMTVFSAYEHICITEVIGIYRRWRQYRVLSNVNNRDFLFTGFRRR
jgi:hypothetical protein